MTLIAHMTGCHDIKSELKAALKPVLKAVVLIILLLLLLLLLFIIIIITGKGDQGTELMAEEWHLFSRSHSASLEFAIIFVRR